jgi:hypothetical protein
MGELDARKKAGEDLEIIIDVSEHKDRQEMMQELQSSIVTVKSLEVRAYDFFLIFRRVFVDVIISFQQRMESRAFFVERRRRRWRWLRWSWASCTTRCTPRPPSPTRGRAGSFAPSALPASSSSSSSTSLATR